MDNKKTNKSSNSFVYTTKDPTITRVVYSLFIFVMLVTLVVNLMAISLTASANQHNGMFFMDGKYYVACSGNSDNAPGAVFEQKTSYATGDKVGYVEFDSQGIAKVTVCNISKVDENGNFSLTNTQGQEFKTGVAKNQILGKFVETLPALTVSFVGSNAGFLVLCIALVALTVVMGLLYFLVSPRGAKKFDKKEDDKKSSPAAAIFSDNAQVLMKYISTDDNIEPLELGENEVTANLNVNYYNSVKLHNGEVYTVVKKYPEAVRTLEEYGASDMDIIKMNMIGNTEFEKLILLPHKEKTMSMNDIIDFVSGLDGVYCVKKRGILNWSFKYKSKTVIIVKQDEDNDGFKVAVKVYPDAATKLNVIYKALEDSTFPIGPFWYMFNNFRNLPGNVIKWLITESLKISKWQQTKADILRDTPTLESMQVDTVALRNAILSGTKVTNMDKFTVITQIADNDTVKYDTVLKTGFGKLDMSDYTKEVTMLVPNTKNLQFSILTKKSMGDALLTSLCNELTELCTPPADYVVPTQSDTPEPTIKKANPTKSASGAKVVKRTTTKKK